ncbi:hypothetical protein [Atopobium sp. oral taxon 810]|uniref:hypothetical protein n=1 Tax=Atopobium sp. oral taxon 810 TaxID=712158 RepID=UPI0003975E3E|nr:hypothetical protein [Atopobium sp. oral taxon 810]ERI06388.1 hypothetical protein HMPREF9069_00195 [Atopobium sp. oral taxon 810 str. F0209]
MSTSKVKITPITVIAIIGIVCSIVFIVLFASVKGQLNTYQHAKIVGTFQSGEGPLETNQYLAFSPQESKSYFYNQDAAPEHFFKEGAYEYLYERIYLMKTEGVDYELLLANNDELYLVKDNQLILFKRISDSCSIIGVDQSK